MPWALFLAVAAVWAMFLIPKWVADRATNNPARPDFGSLQRSNSEARLGGAIGRVLARSGEAAKVVSHRETVLARRRRAGLILLSASIASLAGWFVLNSLWMILVHVIVDAVIVWYVIMLRQIQAFREDVNALFDAGHDVAPASDYSAIKVVQRDRAPVAARAHQ